MKNVFQVFDLRAEDDNRYITPVVEPPPQVPAAPALVGIIASGPDTELPELTWLASVGATQYRVEKQAGTLWEALVTLSANHLTLASDLLEAGVFYRVRAINAVGVSDPSEKASLTIIVT